MPAPLLKISIDLAKIDKEHFIIGKTGKKYLSLAVWENKNGPGQFGDTHYLTQEISKAARDAGQKSPIVGNGRGAVTARPVAKPSSDAQPDAAADDGDSVPF